MAIPIGSILSSVATKGVGVGTLAEVVPELAAVAGLYTVGSTVDQLITGKTPGQQIHDFFKKKRIKHAKRTRKRIGRRKRHRN